MSTKVRFSWKHKVKESNKIIPYKKFRFTLLNKNSNMKYIVN